MSSLFSFFWSGLNWQPAAAFCFVGCFWGPGYSKCSNHIWIVLSESWCGGTGCTAVSQLGVELSLGCSEGGEKVGSKGCASSSCAKQALPEVGASSEQPPHRLVWWSFVQKKSVFVLCESLMFLFSYRLYVCEDGRKSWHHLVVSVAALQPELTSFHHPGGVNAPGALPQERHKIFPENQSAQSYLITIILNLQ